MQTQDLSARRKEAFQALQQVARDMAEQERLCYAAAAKPAMRLRISAFHEEELGYRSFRQFVQDAEAHGFVRLVLARGGDVEILPPGIEALGAPVRVRRDFWTALMGPDSGPFHYIASADRVATGANESGIPLPVVDEDVQTRWLEEFVAAMPEPDRGALQEAVAAAPDLEAKQRTLLRNGLLRRRWLNERGHRVERLLEEWKAEHDLDVKVVSPAEERPRRRDRPAIRSLRPPGTGTETERIRARLHDAIDRMPLGELLRLSIPIEYIVEH